MCYFYVAVFLCGHRSKDLRLGPFCHRLRAQLERINLERAGVEPAAVQRFASPSSYPPPSSAAPPNSPAHRNHRGLEHDAATDSHFGDLFSLGLAADSNSYGSEHPATAAVDHSWAARLHALLTTRADADDPPSCDDSLQPWMRGLADDLAARASHLSVGGGFVPFAVPASCEPGEIASSSSVQLSDEATAAEGEEDHSTAPAPPSPSKVPSANILESFQNAYCSAACLREAAFQSELRGVGWRVGPDLGLRRAKGERAQLETKSVEVAGGGEAAWKTSAVMESGGGGAMLRMREIGPHGGGGDDMAIQSSDTETEYATGPWQTNQSSAGATETSNSLKRKSGDYDDDGGGGGDGWTDERGDAKRLEADTMTTATTATTTSTAAAAMPPEWWWDLDDDGFDKVIDPRLRHEAQRMERACVGWRADDDPRAESLLMAPPVRLHISQDGVWVVGEEEEAEHEEDEQEDEGGDGLEQQRWERWGGDGWGQGSYEESW